jgi:hypothetical protein
LLCFMPGAKIIHLVRHPENVLQSYYYRFQKGGKFKFLRMHFNQRRLHGFFLFVSAVSWLAGNLLLEGARWFGRDRVLRVRYEDLINSPIKELDRIERFIGMSLDEVKRKAKEKESFQIGHNISGNYMRMAGSFVLDPNKASHSNLPKFYSVIVHIICWPLLWVYGYYSSGLTR